MLPLRIGLCFDPAVLRKASSQAKLSSVDILLFPELLDGGYAAIEAGALPHRIDDLFYEPFRAASKELSFCCIAGSTFFEDPDSRRKNSSLAFARGRLIHRYDKIHLFKPTGDHRYFTPGKRISTFGVAYRAGKVRAGVVICYDLRFPELIRAMAMQRMQVLLVPARWPRVRDEAWQTLLKARAIENQIFVVGCNAFGKEGGPSYAFDPLGRMLFSNRRNPRLPLQTFGIDLRLLAEARRLHSNIEEAVFLRRLMR